MGRLFPDDALGGCVRKQWAEAFSKTAHAYWTPERTEQLNRGKNLLVLPGEAPLLLRALGLLNGDGSLPLSQVRKYHQINHLVAVLEPCLLELCEAHPTVHFLDAGCGRSYLTVLLAWVFVHRYQHPVKILGVDRNPELIASCRRRTEMVEFEHVLRYEAVNIQELELDATWQRAFSESSGGAVALHGLLSLHACDTATDDALALGIARGATLIAAVPCCHAELASAWTRMSRDEATKNHALAPLWSIPHLRQATAATLTDTLRTLLLNAAGYRTTVVEFIAAEHTPKNTLIRAMMRHDPEPAALDRYVALRQAIGDVRIALEGQMPTSLRPASLGRAIPACSSSG